MSTDLSAETVLTVSHLYESNRERIAAAIQHYRSVYDLPKHTSTDEVTPVLFTYCKKRLYFVNIVAYQDQSVFLRRAFGTRLGWELPGSAVRAQGDELLQDSVYRIIKRDVADIDISELRPLGYLEKVYTCDGQSITHSGISFLARTRNITPRDIERDEEIKGRFVRIDDQVEIERVQGTIDRKLISAAESVLSECDSDSAEFIDREIESTGRIGRVFRWIHSYVVGPVGRYFCSRKIKAKILLYVKPADIFLDVACGDDDFIYQVAEKAKRCVGNDVQWEQIQFLRERVASRKGRDFPEIDDRVLFTNHDACNLPFRRRFDLTLCKNLLHHMNTAEQLDGLLSSLKRLSRRIIIVDPELPTNVVARFWHWYYVHCLRDQGKRFYEYEQFKKVFGEYFRGHDVEVDLVRTIKGNFIFCSIVMNDEQISSEAGDGAGVEMTGPESGVGTDVIVIMHDTGNNVNKIGAVIFDLDGLLVDTESLFLESVQHALRAEGVNISPEEYINQDVQNGRSVLDTLEKAGRIDDAARVQSIVYQRYEELLRGNVVPMRGAVEAVRRLRSQYALAIASSSKGKFIEYILEELSIRDYFETIVSRECVGRVKPAPDSLLMVVEELHMRVSDCVLVEDSVRGLRAALAIGMPCVVIPNELTRNAAFDGASRILGSLDDLTTDVIKRLMRGKI